MTKHDDSAAGGPARSSRRFAVRAVLAGLALGVLLTVIGGAAFFIWYYREATPRLTQAALDAARERWQAGRLAAYEMDLHLTGAQQASIHVEVRDHKVAAMLYNGQPPRRKATWEAWSIEGLFEMIATELENSQDPSRAYGVNDPSQVVLRADFDSELGFPRKFQRAILGTGASPGSGEIRWEVTHFERK